MYKFLMEMEGEGQDREGSGGWGDGRMRELGRTSQTCISTKINTAAKPNSPQSRVVLPTVWTSPVGLTQLFSRVFHRLTEIRKCLRFFNH